MVSPFQIVRFDLDLQSNLIVAFAGAAVAEKITVELLGNTDLPILCQLANSVCLHSMRQLIIHTREQ